MSHISMFDILDREELAQLTAGRVVRRFRAGETILEPGKEDECRLYLMMEGRAQVIHDRNEVTLARLEPGALFGEMACLGSRKRTNRVVAETEVTGLELESNFLSGLAHPVRDKIKDVLLGMLVNRLDRMNRMFSAVVQLIPEESPYIQGFLHDGEA